MRKLLIIGVHRASVDIVYLCIMSTNVLLLNVFMRVSLSIVVTGWLVSGYQSSFEQPLLSFRKFSGLLSVWSAPFELADDSCLLGT